VTDPGAPRPLHLFLSVGGSPRPLRSAMAALRPDRVTFVVSDGSGGSRSSRDQVEEAVLVDRDGAPGGPGLRHADGCPPAVEVIAAPPDDPDRGFALLRPALVAATADACVVADYTGGTKSMSTALFLAAVSIEGVRVQFMRGERSDLKQVADGTEAPHEPPVRLIGVARRLDLAARFATRRDYGPALAVCKDLCAEFRTEPVVLPPDLAAWRQRAQVGRYWFEMLDAWDRFDFHSAMTTQNKLGGERLLGPSASALTVLRERLAALCEAKGHPSFALVEDLWLNALRRGDLGRWDDAVARLYRCCEAALQAHLWSEQGVETGRYPAARVPDALRADFETRHRSGFATGFLQLGLADTARVLRTCGGRGANAASAIIDDHGDLVGLGWQSKRNKSILAHGFDPLGEQHWREARAWFEVRKKALWEDGLGRATAQQLPDGLPAETPAN
jgi:CRISPR-associated protein (TIGR02710 family)